MSRTDFVYIRELDDDGIDDIHLNLKRLVGNGPQSTTAVLQKDINVPELTGIDSDDIIAMHDTLKIIAAALKGEG